MFPIHCKRRRGMAKFEGKGSVTPILSTSNRIMTKAEAITALRRSGGGTAVRLAAQRSCGSSQLQHTAGYAKAAGSGSANAGRTNLLLKVLEPQQTTPVARTPEELEDAARRSKEYSRQKMRQHRLWQADLSTKLKLKLAALEALPPHLRAAAEKPDLSLFPLNRNIWRDTPPVEAGKGAVTSAAAHAARTRNIGTKRQ